jgi:hypothetical protein
LENLNKRDSLREVGVDERIILKRIVKKQGERTWIGFIWLRTGTCGGL